MQPSVDYITRNGRFDGLRARVHDLSLCRHRAGYADCVQLNLESAERSSIFCHQLKISIEKKVELLVSKSFFGGRKYLIQLL